MFCLLLYPEHLKTVLEGGLLAEEDFFTDLNKRIFIYLRDSYFSSSEAPDIDSVFTVEEIGRITRMKVARMQLTDNGNEILLESVNSLKESLQKKSAQTVSSIDDLNNLIKSMKND